MSKPELPNKIPPPGWEVATIGDLCDLKNGYAFKPADWSTKGLPIVRIQNLNNPKAPFNYYSGELRDRFVINNGDLLFAWSGTPGTSFGAHIWRGGKAALNQHIFRVDFPESFLNKKYFMYAINQKLSSLIERAHGGVGLRHVTKGKFEDTNIELSPLNEQHRIVAKIEALFSELDKGIEALKTACEQLKVYRQAVLKHAFEGKLTARWREENKEKLESPEQLLARIPVPKQPRGGREASIEVIEGIAALAVNKPSKPAPKGWMWTPLLRVARQETGHTPSRKHSEYWGGDQYWIGIVDARHHNGQIIHDTIQKVTRLGLDNSSARTLPAGTVCLSRTASVGYVCILGKPMATSQDFATWTCTEALDPKFLMYALMAEGDEIRRFGKGTTHTTIYFPEIRALHICLPSIQEQKVLVKSIESKLQQISKMSAEIENQLIQSEILRQSILKKAFSGQLISQDQGDEPASVLLERIKAEKQEVASIQKRGGRKATDKSLPPDNVIPMPQRIAGISTTDLHAGILALAYSSHQEKQSYAKTFHHVKGEKISHMVEAYVAIDLDRTPVKDAAGPNDFPHLKKVESRAQKANWFLMKKDRASGTYSFKPGRNFEILQDKVKKALGERLARVESLLIMLRPLNTQQTEIVATLYAAWNNLLLLGKKPDDKEIVFEARENWHPAKLKIERWRFFKGLEWMRDHELIPAGNGRLVKAKDQAKSLQKSKRK